MEAPAYVPDTTLPQSQRGSSDLPLSPGSSQASPEEGAIRYLCPICHKGYAQRQGAWLHIRTVHNPNPKKCFLCEFTYARPYEYRGHLRKKHPGVNPDVILGKAPGSRRRTTTLTEHLPQQPPVSPPAVEQDQQNWAESQPNPSVPPSPAPAGVSSVSPPSVSSVDYNSQPVYAEPEQTVTMMDEDKHEYAPRPEFLDATYHLAMLPSTLDISPQDPGQFGLPSAHTGGSTATNFPRRTPKQSHTSTHSPSNPETAPMRHSPFYSPFFNADIDAAFDSIFTF